MVSTSGLVFRLGKSFVADLVEIGKVEPHWSSVFNPGRKVLMVFQANGFVKEYDMETFEISRTWNLGWKVWDSVVVDGGASIVTLATAATPGDTSVRYNSGNALPAQAMDAQKFEIPK